MEKPLMRSLKDSRSEIAQTTVCSFVHSFFHVVSNSLHIPWVSVSQEVLPNQTVLSVLTLPIQATATLWPPLQKASQLVHQASQILANEPEHTGAQVRSSYLAFVQQMQEQQAELGPLGETIAHFCHLTKNFAPGLFQCYDVEGLPCTNNALEACFGVARVHERRATGRRGAIPSVVVPRVSARHRRRCQPAAAFLSGGPAAQRLSPVA